MSCFNNRSSCNMTDHHCSGNTLCSFNGNLDDVVSVPVYVQYVFDAVQFNLQGMKTVQNQSFSPAIPCGYTIKRIAGIRTKSFFNPCNVDDSRNLTVDMDTTLSGASFLQDCHGNPIEVIGPDGTYSQKILYPDNSCCSEDGRGVPVFGTQNVSISGNVTVYVDLILCDHCNHETKFTVSAEVPIATRSKPMNLTNFFEICIPENTDQAFLPRFTELTNCATEARLATNNCSRDLNVNQDGELYGNLIIALCVSAEKKVLAPVQMCVLSTGMADIPTQTNSICSSFPSMFTAGFNRTTETDRCDSDNQYHTIDDCGCEDHHHHHHDDCGCEDTHRHYDDCGCEETHHHHDDCGCNDHIMPRNCR